MNIIKRGFRNILAVSVLLACLVGTANAGINDGLIGYWKFDEGSGTYAYDSTGWGHGGTINGASFVPGQINTGLYFNGVNQNVVIPTAQAYQGQVNLVQPNITVSAFVKVDTLNGDIVSVDGETFDRRYQLSIINGHFRPHAGYVVNGFKWFDSPRVIALGSTHHVAMTVDNYGIKLYIDGVLDSQMNLLAYAGTDYIGSAGNTQPLRIGGGAPPGANQLFFTGDIDDVRIYNRALSASEIAQLANSVAQPTQGGPAFGWGYNGNGQFGNGSTGTPNTTPVSAFGTSDVTAIAAGNSHALALKSDGTVWSAGSNAQGQLGIGGTVNQTTPVQVAGLGGVTAVAAGYWHSLALKSNGTVWAWGYGVDGQLGNNSAGISTLPWQVAGLSGVTAIAAGYSHSMAVKSDGTVWAWGYNNDGELGNGNTGIQWTPVQVSGLSGVTAVAAGYMHSMALKSDGTVWAWGYGGHGQLGNGNTATQLTPVQVSGLSGVIAIAAGNGHSLALKSDGTVWAWGYGANGQLGNGNTADQYTPVQVSGLSGVIAIAGGAYHSLALKSDGTVWAWGNNAHGELGDGNTATQTTPIQVSGLSGATAIAAFGITSMAISSAAIAGPVDTDGDGVPDNIDAFPLDPAASVDTDGDGHPDAWNANATPAQIAASTLTLDAYPNDPNIWQANTGYVSGTVSNQTGLTGNVLVGLATDANFTNIVATTTADAAGAFSLTADTGGNPLPFGTYYLGAFVDTNGNQIQDPNEFGAAYSSTVVLSSTSPSISVSFAVTPYAPAASGGAQYNRATGQIDYFAAVVLGDPAHMATAVTVTGPDKFGGTSTLSLAYDANKGMWTTWLTVQNSGTDPFQFGTTHPATPLSYTFTVTKPDGTTMTLSDPIGFFPSSTPFINNPADGSTLSVPLASVNWSATPVAGETFELELIDSTALANGAGANASIWYKTNQVVAGPNYSVAYDGPLLVSGHQYEMHVRQNNPDGNSYNGAGDAVQFTFQVDTTPPVITVPADVTVEATGLMTPLSAGSAGGQAFAWGWNNYGQLGDGTATNRSTPVQVSGLNDATAISGGQYHSLALKPDGTVWAWGWNYYGQLGDGTLADRTTPVQVSGLSGVIAIAGGGDFSLALRSDGTVWAWGSNSRGQLGDGTTTNRTIPVQVSGLSGVTAIAAGFDHALVLKSDGTVWAWGNNGYGQLGDGTGTNQTTPVQVSGLSGVTAIAAGYNHSQALKPDGSVWAWGWNLYGQLGDGTTTNRLTPVQVSALSGVVAIGSGIDFSLALKSDGTVWASGNNGYGQLGDGTTTQRTTPVQVSGLSGVAAIAAGTNHSLALKSDGTVWDWGYAEFGQLGDGTVVKFQSTPVQVSGLSGVVAIAGGEGHSLAITSASFGSAGSIGTATATDLVDGSVAVTNNAPATFPVGTTVVTYTATDAAGNTATATQNVTVTDTTPPSVLAPVDVTVEATGSTTAVTLGTATASDLVDGTLTPTPDQTGPFTVGVHTITWSATDSHLNTGTATQTVTIGDTTAPVIALIGAATLTVAQGSAFTDPGATVTDNVDTGLIATVTGAVDTATVGTYTLTYNVSDTAGNAAIPVTRTINVTDQTAPAIALAGPNPMTVAQGSTFADPGSTVTDNVDTGLVATVTGTVDTATVGTYTLTYTATDAAGNVSTVTRTVNVTDQTAPTVTTASMTSNNAVRSSMATVGDVITLSFTTSEVLGTTPTVTIGGRVATVSGSGTAWSATVTVDATTTNGIQNGSVTITDVAGNTATQIVSPVVIADTVAPVITLNGASSVTVGVGNPYVDAGATALDNGVNDLTGSISVSGTVDTATVGTYTITYNVTDAAGNAATPVTRTVNVTDQTAPVIALNGAATLTVAQGSAFTDPGTTVTDNVDTGLVASVTGTVDTNVVGTYTLTYNVSDVAGNAATPVTRTVIVADQTAPVIALIGAATMTVAQGSAFTDPGTTVTDNVDTGLVAVATGAVNTNVVGTYILTYNVTDAAGNAATPVTRTVNVTDQTAPVIALNGAATMTVAQGSAFTDPGTTVTDNVDTGLTATVTGAVDTATVGTYTLTYNVSDAAGNAATPVTRTVNVTDQTAPVIALNGAATMTVAQGSTFADPGTTVTDNVDTGLVATVTGAVDTATVGTYTLTYNVSDAAGNAATPVTRTVNVTDQTAPVIALVGANLLTVAQGSAFIDPGTTVTDNVDTGLLATVTGTVDTATVGIYTLTYNVSDAAGNAATPVTRTVKVTDQTPPVVAAPANVVKEATGPTTAVTLGVATVTDNVDVGLVAAPDQAGPFAPGTYTITWSATDAAGNTGTATQTVTITDKTPPVLTVPANVTAEANGNPGSTVAIGTATATDLVDGAVAVTNNAPATFPLGTTTVTYTSTDAHGNTATATQTVTVQDTTPPVLTVPANVKVEATGPQTSVSIGTATGTDLFGSVTIASNAPTTYPLGTTTVTWTATDANGNSSTGTQTVTVVDTTPPTVTAQLVPVHVKKHEGTFKVVFSASDLVDPNPAPTATLNGVTVTNGQIVELKAGKKVKIESEHGELEIRAPSFSLNVNATDFSSNTGTDSAAYAFPLPQDEDNGIHRGNDKADKHVDNGKHKSEDKAKVVHEKARKPAKKASKSKKGHKRG